MAKRKSRRTIQKRSKAPLSLAHISAIAGFAGIATYAATSSYAQQAQAPADSNYAVTTTLDASLPLWATVLAVSLPFVILLPISIAKTIRRRQELLASGAPQFGPALASLRTPHRAPSAPKRPPVRQSAPRTTPRVIGTPPPVAVPSPSTSARSARQPGGIPANSLGIGVSLKSMVVRSMREQAARTRSKR